MKYFKALFCVLLAGTCTGIFFYLQTLPFLRVSLAASGGYKIFWAISSFAQFGGIVLAANGALLVIWLGYSWGYARYSGMRWPSALQLDAPTYLPLCILASALLQFTQLTRYFEGLLLLAQHASDLFLLIALLGVYHLKAENVRQVRQTVSERRKPQGRITPSPTWQGKTAVFLISFGIYALVGVRLNYSDQISPGGDEPHYLVITHSLLYDHDLQIANNYKQRDYRAFFQGELKPHVSIGRSGVRYPGHPLGLSFLLLPAYALKGYRGAVVCLNLLAALLAVQLYLIAFALTRRNGLALLLWGITSFTTPLLIYSCQIYPETPSALLLAIVLRILIAQTTEKDDGQKRSIVPAFVLGCALGFLPWLQQRMILPAGLLLCYYVLTGLRLSREKAWDRQRRAALLIPTGLFALSGLALAGFYFILYGNPLPNAPYASVGITSVFALDILLRQGLWGLLLDQEAGLLIYAPYYLFAFAGVLLLLRRRFQQACWLILTMLSIYLPCGGFVLRWWGAWSPAARYMVVLIPFLLIPLSVCLKQLTHRLARYLFFCCVVVSFGWSGLFLHTPAFTIMSDRGLNNVLGTYSAIVDLSRYFPAFINSARSSHVVAGMWLLISIAGVGWLYRSAFPTVVGKATAEARPAPRRPLTAHVKTVYACYSGLFVFFLIFTALAEHAAPHAQAPLLNKNRPLRKFLKHLDYAMLVSTAPLRQDHPPAEELQFTYITEEKLGKVNEKGPRFLVTGPREAFPKGKYTVYFQLRAVTNATADVVATLDVVASRGQQVFQTTVLRGKDFSVAQQSQLIPLSVELDDDVTDLETRVYFQNRVELAVKKITIQPDLAELYYNAGLAAWRNGQTQDAKTIFLRALAAADHVQAAYQVGVLEQSTGNWERSLELLQWVVTREPDFADAQYRLGVAYRETGDFEQARSHFEQATQLLPAHVDAWRALQMTYRQLKLEMQARKAAEAIAALDQPQTPVTVNFANQIMLLGYTVGNPAPGKLHLEYYWQALSPMDRDYTFFVHFNDYGLKFQQDHVPQIRDAVTAQLKMHPTSQWQVGELVHEEFDIAAPPGTFTLSLGAWDSKYTRKRLLVLSTPQLFFLKKTELTLGQITVN